MDAVETGLENDPSFDTFSFLPGEEYAGVHHAASLRPLGGGGYVVQLHRGFPSVAALHFRDGLVHDETKKSAYSQNGLFAQRSHIVPSIPSFGLLAHVLGCAYDDRPLLRSAPSR
jgi:hypothetical protein